MAGRIPPRRTGFIPGQKIYLRPFEVADAKDVCRWMNDREVLRFISKTVPLNLFREEEFLKTLYRDEENFHLGIVARRSNKLIGRVSLLGIHTVSRHAELQLIIGEKAYWGKGYGREADLLMVDHGFQSLNLNKIYAYILSGHGASLKIVQDLGFTEEGILREHVYRDGLYQDLHVLAVLRRDYKGRLQPAKKGQDS